MATVALQLAVRADGHVCAVLLTAGAPPGDADMHDEVRLPSDSVRLEILGVPATRLQAGAMKLKSGPPSKGQVVGVYVPLGSVKTVADVIKQGSRKLFPVTGVDEAIYR